VSQCLSATCVGHVSWGVRCCSHNLEKLNELFSKGSAQTPDTFKAHSSFHRNVTFSSVRMYPTGKVLVSTRESLILEMAEVVNVPREIGFLTLCLH